MKEIFDKTKIETPEVFKNRPFDNDLAKKIRLEKDLSITELVKELGAEDVSVWEGNLLAYEIGIIDPTSNWSCPKRYRAWLRKFGYDPYGLRL